MATALLKRLESYRPMPGLVDTPGSSPTSASNSVSRPAVSRPPVDWGTRSPQIPMVCGR